MGDIRLDQTFDQSRLSTASTRIAEVARVNDCTILSDPNHARLTPYEVLADNQTMSALANAGVKHIGVESLTSENAAYQAYYRGELSERTMQYGMTTMGPPSLYELYRGQRDAPEDQVHYELIKNARANGILVHGLNGAEGADLPREEREQILDELGQMKLAGLHAIEANPEFFNMSRREQGDFMTKSLYDAGYNNTEVRDGLIYMGYRREESLSKIENLEQAITRLNQDPDVVDRLREFTKGEKTVAVYGAAHTLRTFGDIDDGLQCSVINISQDPAGDMALMKPDIDQLTSDMGVSFTDMPDYELNPHQGLWTDNQTGQVSRIAIPSSVTRLPPVPEPKPDPAPQQFTPGTQSPSVIDSLRF